MPVQAKNSVSDSMIWVRLEGVGTRQSNPKSHARTTARHGYHARLSHHTTPFPAFRVHTTTHQAEPGTPYTFCIITIHSCIQAESHGPMRVSEPAAVPALPGMVHPAWFIRYGAGLMHAQGSRDSSRFPAGGQVFCQLCIGADPMDGAVVRGVPPRATPILELGQHILAHGTDIAA